MYHFRLKTDKKLDGTRISPVQHIDYIRHEGKYLEEKEWAEKNKFAGDLITSAYEPFPKKRTEKFIKKTRN